MPNRFINVSRVDNQGDRVLLYGKSEDYHVIAERDDEVRVGDEIEYDPYGANFGWFVRKVNTGRRAPGSSYYELPSNVSD